MKKLLIGLILILLAGAGWYAYQKYGKTEDKATVTQAALTQGNIVQAVQATGTLEALRTVQVGSQVSGTVKSLYVDFNSIVKKDQIIAELDPSLLQVQVDVQEANIQRQEGDIAQQEVQLENDQINAKRSQAQFAAGLVSQQQLEAAQLQVKTRAAQIESAKKQLIQARAQLNQAKLNVSYCTIRSPIDGVIVNRAADVGQTVQSSMQVATLFLIATDLTTLKLSAGVDEADIGYIRRGMTVSFIVDSYPTQTFTGMVDAVRLNAQTQNNVVTYPVWITVQNPDFKLRPSMTANLRIIVDQANNVLKVPNQALRFRPTTDIYTWLGITPPAAGRGRGALVAGAEPGGRGAGGREATGPGATAPEVTRGAGGRPGADLQANAGMGAQGTEGNNQNRPRRERQTTQDQAGGEARQPPGEGRGFGQGRGQGGGFGQGRAEGGSGEGRRGGQGFGAQGGQFPRGEGAGAGAGVGGRGSRGGFGEGMRGNLTPEQIEQFRQQFGDRGGRGFGRGAQQQPQAPADTEETPLTERNAEKIDDLFSAVPKRIQPGQIWLYDEKAPDPNKKLRQVSVRLGLTDGQFSELVSAGEDLKASTMVVTGVVPPPSALPKPGQTNIFQQQRGGFGPPGGFGGDRGGGGGGGGRGGGGR